MASTLNCRVIIEGVLNGRLVDAGTGLHSPFTIATSGDTASEFDVAVTALATGQLILSLATQPVMVYFNPKVAGVLSWRGTADADNSSVYLPANSHFLIPSGQTTTYTGGATPETRCETAKQAFTQFWFDADSDGKVVGLVVT